MKTCFALLMVITTLTASAANPLKRFEIDYNGEIFKQESVLKLKQEVKKTHPNINFDRWDLKRVILRAKSARGFAEAYLKVGRYESRIETIDGNRFDFNTPGDFQKIDFEAPRRNDDGVWQIHMKGKVKVKKVVLVAQKKEQRPQVTRTCSYQLETVWGKDIRRFSAQAQGPRGTGVQAEACQKARKKCVAFQSEIPLTQCTKL